MALFNNLPQVDLDSGEFKDVILLPGLLNNPVLSFFMSVSDGMKAGGNVGMFGRLSKISKLDAGCSSTPSAAKIPFTSKKWDPVGIEMWLNQCYTELQGTFLEWGLALGYERPNLSLAKIAVNGTTQNYWDEFVKTQAQDAAFDDQLRIIFFGNKDITAAQLPVNGAADIPNYNHLDGIWQQVFDGVTAGTIKRATITKNSAATYALQELLETDTVAKATFRKMLGLASQELKDSDPIFLVTESLWQNFVDERASHNLETSYKITEDGLVPFMYRGVPIVVCKFMDRIIQTDFDNGTKLDLPHRALLTTKANLKVGVDTEDGVSQFESHYEWVKKEMHMRGMYQMDVHLLKDSLVVAAY